MGKALDAIQNPRQRKFCIEFIVDNNGTQAAIRAGYSENSARQTAAKLLSKANIQAAIAELKKEQEARTIGDADKVIHELALIAFSDIKKFVTWAPEERVVGVDPNGRPVKVTVDCIHLLPSADVDGRVIQEVSHTQHGIKIKLYDKVEALMALGEHFGVLGKKRMEVTGKDGGPIEHHHTGRFAGMSDKELAALILQAAKDIAEGEVEDVPKKESSGSQWDAYGGR